MEATSAAAPNINETMILKKVVYGIDSMHSCVYDLNKICLDNNIKRRGLYDFLSIASAFGICKKLSSDRFDWNGFTHLDRYIQNLAQQIECEARVRKMSDIFDCSSNASLQNIALNLIKLFHYLGVKYLDLRQVARLFAGKYAKYKTMLRKLYTISSSLEIAMIISKTTTSAEIKLNFSVKEPEYRGAMDIMSLLNTKKELETESVYEKRRKEFENYNQTDLTLHIKSIMPKREILNPLMNRQNIRFPISIE